MSEFFRIFVIEAGVWAAAVPIALLTARAGVFAKIERGFRYAGAQTAWCFAFLFLAGIAFRLALLPVLPVPEPSAHDEYSYLFAADTFHGGRLTNPTPPLPIAFESFHVNVWPTYQSMYPPAVGLILAAGQFLGNPWFGILLTTPLMCGVIYWALRSWLPPGWALLGGCMAVANYCGYSWWMNRYFAPSITAIGGALILGVMPNIIRSRSPGLGDRLLLGLGAVLLLLSRPYEGFVYCLPFLFALLWYLGRRRGWLETIRILIPAAALLAVAILWLGYYNWRGTGSPFLMPYSVNWKTYHFIPALIFGQTQPIPAYHHALMRNFYIDWDLPRYLQLQTRIGLWYFTEEKLTTYLLFFLPLSTVVFAIGFLQAFRSRRRQFLGIVALCMAAGLWVESWRPMPHYASPATALVLLLVVGGYRWLCRWRVAGHNIGRAMARALAILLVLIAVNNLLSEAVKTLTIYPDREPQYQMRARILSQLERTPGKHLVLVRYAPDHYYEYEWVYNRADLKNASVVWARSLDPETDADLIKAFPGRQVWLVEPDRLWLNLSTYHLGASDQVLADLDPGNLALSPAARDLLAAAGRP